MSSSGNAALLVDAVHKEVMEITNKRIAVSQAALDQYISHVQSSKPQDTETWDIASWSKVLQEAAGKAKTEADAAIDRATEEQIAAIRKLPVQ